MARFAASFASYGENGMGTGMGLARDNVEPVEHSQEQVPVVVLLHGLFAGRDSMSEAQQCVRQAGYRPINWRYRTMAGSIQKHAERLLPDLFALAADERVSSINFLTHSCGGIIVRYALQELQLPKLGRLVMLSPPNGGTTLARYSVGLFDRLYPIVRQLSDAADSLPNRLLPIKGLEIGVIAAESDWVVKMDNTKVRQQVEHCVVPTTHCALPKHTDALDKAVRFLRYGSFVAEQLPVAA